MTLEEHKAQLETFADDADLAITDSILGKIARRAKQLESESDFTLDDIKEELLEVIPARFQKDVDWDNFINECALFVFDEKEENGDEESDYE